MVGRTRMFGGSMAAGAALLALAIPASANATTFCVPTYHPACPNNGTNVAEASLDVAMKTSATDGQADSILLAAGEITNPDTYEASGTDPLLIEGRGAAQTTVTNTSNVNAFVMNLNGADARAVTLRDLTIAIPATMPDDGGAAAQLNGDTLEDVDIVSRNPAGGIGIGSTAIANWSGPITITGGEFREEAGGALHLGLASGVSATGTATIEGLTIRSAYNGITLTAPNATTNIRRTRVQQSEQSGITASAGTGVVENTIVTTSGEVPFAATANSANNVTLTADHSTFVNTGAITNLAPVESMVLLNQTGDATVEVANSIARGYDIGYLRQGRPTGDANLSIAFSNVVQSGISQGNGTLQVAGQNNITADPLFADAAAGDYSLLEGSPSIDAGDPGAGLATDFELAPRPVDGNDDGSAVRDQGAFEFQPAEPPPPPPPPPGGDTDPPQTSIDAGPGKKAKRGKVRFEFSADEPGATFECRVDAKAFRACSSPYAAKRLKRGRHTFSVRAIDAAGNVDPTPAEKRFKVKRR